MISYDGYDFTDLQYNLYILKKHLTLYCKSESTAAAMLEKHKDNLFGQNGLAVSLGEHDFKFFCLYFLQDTFIPKDDNTARELGSVHYEVWEDIQKMFVEDLYDREEFILPRGWAKSTIINKALSCYVHCYKKSRYTIVLGNKETDSVQFTDDTRKMLGNKYIVEGFGNLIDKKSRTVNKIELELSNNTKIQAFSWGSSVRGTTYGCSDGIFRPGLVICDDVISEDDILSDNAKDKVLKKFYTEIAEVGDTEVVRKGKKIKSATKFIIVGTPLSSSCFINTISKDSTFKVFRRGVVDFDIDEYFDNNEYWQHYRSILFNEKIAKEDKDIMLKEYYSTNKKQMEFETIWEKYQCDKLAEKYFTNRTAFMQELMCATEKIGEVWFKTVRTMPSEEIEENTFEKTMLCIDPASTVNKKSDYTAMVVGSESTAGLIYGREVILEKLEFNKYCDKVVDLLVKYPEINDVYIEKNTYQGSDVLKIKEMVEDKLKNRQINFINEMQRKNKDEKISTITDLVNTGQIILTDSNKDAINQLLEFRGQHYSLHDDFPDVLAELVIRLKALMKNNKITLMDRRQLGV